MIYEVKVLISKTIFVTILYYHNIQDNGRHCDNERVKNEGIIDHTYYIAQFIS